jgi:Flp pilus assembly protein TadD
MAAALAGCQSRDPSTTGSISFGAPAGSEADLRRTTAELGPRFQADPRNVELALEYARALRALGQTSTAVAVLQQAALRNPNNPPLLAAYGKVLADSGRYREAAAVLANAHRPERPDWRILSTQGAVADQLGEFENAQRYYAAALRIVPGEPSVLANQGLSFALAKRLDEAERVLTIAVQHPRADERVRRNLALVLSLRGRFADAEGVLRRDMPAKQAGEVLAGMKGVVKENDSWAAIRQADKARAGSAPDTAPAPATSKVDARRVVRQQAAIR